MRTQQDWQINIFRIQNTDTHIAWNYWWRLLKTTLEHTHQMFTSSKTDTRWSLNCWHSLRPTRWITNRLNWSIHRRLLYTEHSRYSRSLPKVRRAFQATILSLYRLLTSSHQFHSNEENPSDGREGLFDGRRSTSSKYRRERSAATCWTPIEGSRVDLRTNQICQTNRTNAGGWGH